MDLDMMWELGGVLWTLAMVMIRVLDTAPLVWPVVVLTVAGCVSFALLPWVVYVAIRRGSSEAVDRLDHAADRLDEAYVNVVDETARFLEVDLGRLSDEIGRLEERLRRVNLEAELASMTREPDDL